MDLWDALLLQAGPNAAAVTVATALLGIAAGLVGSFALLRRQSLLSDTLGHATLPGLAGAFLLVTACGGDGRNRGVLLLGAGITAVFAMALEQWLRRHRRIHSDTSLAVVLSTGYAAGVVLLSVVQGLPEGNRAGLGAFIQGQTAALWWSDALWFGGLAAVVVAVAWGLRRPLIAVAFDPADAHVHGIPVGTLDLILGGLLVMVTLAGLQSVGLLLVVAMVVVPAATARLWARRPGPLLLLAACCGGAAGWWGSCLSALAPARPAGAVIVLTAGALFCGSLLLAPERGLAATWWRRHRKRRGLLAALQSERPRHGGDHGGASP